MNKIKAAFAVVAVAMLAFIFCSCSSGNKADSRELSKGKRLTDVCAPKAEDKFHYSSKERSKQKKVSSTEMTGLFFDEENFSISVYDSASRRLWRSLPEKASGESTSVAKVTLLVDGNEYTLNTQDDCVALKKADYAVKDDGVHVKYNFSKVLKNKTKIDFVLPMSFTVKDGMLTVRANCSDLNNSRQSENVVVKSVELLNYFSADTDGMSGDYIFVPDGPGAIISTEQGAQKFNKLVLPVYGADYGEGERASRSVPLPAFGRTKGGSAFVALIEKGDAIAEIVAAKATAKGGYNRVYPRFNIVPCSKRSETTFCSELSYKDEIAVSYRFLSGENANYIGMAGAIREQLVRNGTLTFRQNEESKSESLPFNLSLLASAQLENKKGTTVLTTLEEAQDIAMLLRSKGIKNINLQYAGAFEGSLNPKKPSSPKLISSLGTKAELEQLLSYAKNQSINLFGVVNLFSSAKGGFKKSVTTPTGEKAIVQTTPIKTKQAVSTADSELCAVCEIENSTVELLRSLREYPLDGTLICDSGLLYSDSGSKRAFTRQEMCEIAQNQIASFSAEKMLMTCGGNIYSVKYADIVSKLESKAQCSKNEFCTTVPFLQAVLHGYVDYSLTELNKEADMEKAFLKSVEYGAVPSFEWYYQSLAEGDEIDRLCYEATISDAQQYYERMDGVLSDLRNKKITAHYLVQSGVYCTEYGSKSRIYVNYNKKDKTVNGITVEGRSFVRVN